MGGFTIRAATAADGEAVAALWKVLEDAQGAHRALPKAADADERLAGTFARALGDPDQAWIVAERAGAVVGMAHLHVERPSRMSDVAVLELSRVVVAPEARGLGLGRALVDHAEEIARDRGIGFLSVRYMIANEGAAAFWSGEGFTPFLVTGLRRLTR